MMRRLLTPRLLRPGLLAGGPRAHRGMFDLGVSDCEGALRRSAVTAPCVHSTFPRGAGLGRAGCRLHLHERSAMAPLAFRLSHRPWAGATAPDTGAGLLPLAP